MPTPSPMIVAFMQSFAVAFTRPTFEHAIVLVTGTLLASGRRTVASALRAAGLIDERHFTTYHRVLNRTVWSPLPAAQQNLAWAGDRCLHRGRSAVDYCHR